MKIISVIPLKKGIQKGNLTYFTGLNVPEGHIVSIPFRSKKTLGLVVESEELRETKGAVKGMGFNLRKVTEDLGKSIFTKEFLDSVFETGRYFAQKPGRIVPSFIPTIFIEEYQKISSLVEKNKKSAEESEKNKEEPRAERFIFQAPLAERLSIYKTMIREAFAKKKSVFIILPTEFGIENFTENLSRGIEQFTFILHGQNTAKKNLSACEKILSADHPLLILSTVPFLSIPKSDIGLIILEEENGSAYRTIGKPHIDLRVFVEVFASKINAKLVMADELLRFETLERRDLDSIPTLYPPSFRTEFRGRIEIVGKNSPGREKPVFKVLNDKTVEEIKEVLSRGKNVFIFSLRKGLATLTLCRDCGSTVACDYCGSTLVLYTSRDGKKRMFVCNKCGTEKSPETVCSVCGSWNLLPIGIGTDTVYDYASTLFPKAKILKLDKESIKTKNQAKKIITDFEESKGAILVGTEMAMFYLKERVTLSVIASFDSLWSIPSFRMGEKILCLLLSVMKLTSSKLIVQAKNHSDGAIQAVQKENFLSFVREDLQDRKKLGYPPFKRFIKVTYMGEKSDVPKIRSFLSERFKEYNPDIFSGFVERIAGRYVVNMLIKTERKKWSLPSLTLGGEINEELSAKLTNLPPDFEISVDPEDLL